MGVLVFGCFGVWACIHMKPEMNIDGMCQITRGCLALYEVTLLSGSISAQVF
jgi:hypothetical protein